MAIIAGKVPLPTGAAPPQAVRVTAIVVTSALGVLVLVDAIAVATAVVILLFALTAMTVSVIKRQLAADDPDPDAITREWLLRSVAPLIAALAMVIGGGILVSEAATTGTAARAGQSTRSLMLYGIPVVSWRVDAATLT